MFRFLSGTDEGNREGASPRRCGRSGGEVDVGFARSYGQLASSLFSFLQELADLLGELRVLAQDLIDLPGERDILFHEPVHVVIDVK